MNSITIRDAGDVVAPEIASLSPRLRRLQSSLERSSSAFPLSTTERQVVVAAADALAAAVGCGIAFVAWERSVGRLPSLRALWPMLFSLAWVMALVLVDGYDVQIPASRVRSLVVVFKALPLASFFAFFAFFAQPYGISRPLILITMAADMVLVVGMRLTLARLLLHERFAKRAILVTGDPPPSILAEVLEEARFEYRVVGTVGATQGSFDEFRRLGPPESLVEIVRRHRAHEVIVGSDSVGAGAPIEDCFNQGIRIISAADLFERYKGRVPIYSVDERWFQTLPAHSLSSKPYLAVHRAVDIVLSAVLGVPFLFILPLLAALIKVESPGPVFFRQLRVGQFGNHIHILKLRTMGDDAELTGVRWAERHDPRVTRFGSILRATRLDELPQLINVFRGDMSFIGPRPERPEFVVELERVIPHYRARLAIKPGISGWAQVKDGYASSISETVRKLEYDLYYIKHQCLRLDLQILLHTLFTVLGFRGR